MIDFSAINEYTKEFDLETFCVYKSSNKQWIQAYSNIPCHSSFSKVDNTNSEQIPEIDRILKLNFSQSLDIKKGDYIKVYRGNSCLYNGKCSTVDYSSSGRNRLSISEWRNGEINL